MEEAMTVDKLYAILADARKKGLGSKNILIADDEEGNGYHHLFGELYAVTPDVFAGPYAPLLPIGIQKKDLSNYVILE